MPEGDTIARTAARLAPALEGRVVTRFAAPRLRGDRPRAGARVEGVEARGKNLLVHLSGDLTLRTHLRMTGSWHLYRVGDRWQRPAHLARVEIEVEDGWVAVCFSAPTVETYRRSGAEPRALADLGPDLCRPGSSDQAVVDQVLDRLRTIPAPDAEIGDVLLDQRVAAGIGNVYKSEACFACGLDPFTRLADLDDATRSRLYATAASQLRSNLGPGRRTTSGDGLAVYGRAGRPCLRCGTPIRRRRQGEMARSTYWCPTCQPPRPAGATG